MTTTTLSITRAARVGADLVDRAQLAGLPIPHHLTTTRDGIDLIVDNFEGKGFLRVAAWAKWLGVQAESRMDVWGDEDVHFVEARAEVEGVRVEVATTWRTPHEHKPVSDAREQDNVARCRTCERDLWHVGHACPTEESTR